MCVHFLRKKLHDKGLTRVLNTSLFATISDTFYVISLSFTQIFARNLVFSHLPGLPKGSLPNFTSNIIPLSANPIKWSNTLKHFVSNLPTNCLSVFDHFVKLALKGLSLHFTICNINQHAMKHVDSAIYFEYFNNYICSRKLKRSNFIHMNWYFCNFLKSAEEAIVD